MSTASAISSGVGKQARDRVGANLPRFGETSESVINKIKEMYDSPAVLFGRWLNISGKTAKRKLNYERCLTAEELGVLIRSEQGFQILEAIMGNAKPAWWRIVVPLMDAADARKMQIAARRRLKQTIESALDADQSLTRAIQAAEALSDQDHAGPHVDALRTMGGLPDRAVAKGRAR